jgi:hypothetical protein
MTVSDVVMACTTGTEQHYHQGDPFHRVLPTAVRWEHAVCHRNLRSSH